MSITTSVNVEISAQAQELLQAVMLRCNFVDAWLKGEILNPEEELSEDEPITFLRCFTRLILMGGSISKESDTMLISQTRSGMTVGMHFDGKEWSLNS